jgi:hypothetical protein
MMLKIRNIIQASRMIALSDGDVLTRKHIDQMLKFVHSFEDDMRGGNGFREALRHYA